MMTSTFRAAILAGFALLVSSFSLPALAAETSSWQPGLEAAPVVVDGYTLFQVRGVEIYSASRRAGEIAERIRMLARDPAITTNEIQLVVEDQNRSIMAGDLLIVRVLDEDAKLTGLSPDLSAAVFHTRILEAIARYRHERMPSVVVARALRALLATVVFVVLLWILGRIHRRVSAIIQAQVVAKLEKGVQIQSFEIVRRQHIWAVYRGVMDVLRLVVIAFAIYLYLQRVLTLFPWTRRTGLALLEMLVSPLQVIWGGVIGYLPNLIFLIILFVVVRYLLRVVKLLFLNVERGVVQWASFEPEWSMPTYRLARVAIIIFSLVAAYPYIPGSDSSAFKGISVFMGVVLSLGSSSLVGNLIAGYTMTYRKAFKLGDRIRVGDHLGDVEEIRMLITRLRSLKNEDIVIPNSEILSRDVINYSNLAATGGLIVHTTVGIGYETPWRQVEAMLQEAAAMTEGAKKDPPPFVLQKALGDFAVTYEINVYCDDPKKMMAVATNLHRNIQDVFNTHGVQIMTPNYENDPDEPKLVPPEKWYEAPAVKPPPSA
ncbi:MAG: mechanosensitive ion channel family protein [Kiritimatiellae bacterium]|nr:mechanosensitive ion channel family protein [Kiritimatiellia bacterium]